MNNKLIVSLIVILFAGAYFVGRWLQPVGSDGPTLRQMAYDPCSPARSECTAFLDDQKIVFSFLQPPSALQPFDVQLVTEGFEVDNVQLEFYMKGMDMGVNQYSMQPIAPHDWQTKVTLPVCSLGRHDWLVRLKVDTGASSWLAEFSFEQTGN